MPPEWLQAWLAFNAGLLIVLLLRPLWHRSRAPATVYLLWLLPLLMALASALPRSPLLPTVSVPLTAAPSSSIALAASTSPFSMGLLLCVLAQAGSLLLILHLLVRQIRLMRQWQSRVGEVVADWPGVSVLRGAVGPALTGLIRPRLILPRDFELRFTPAQQRLAIAHERAHWRAGDLPWRLLAWLCVVLQWWNPLAWWALRCFINDQELANDARVLRAHPGAELEYAHTLALAQDSVQAPMLCAMQTTHPLLWRVTMLRHHASHPASSRRLRLLTGLTLLGLTSLVMALDTSAPPPAENQFTVMVDAEFPGFEPATFAVAGPMDQTMSARLGEGTDAVNLAFTVTRTADPRTVLVSTAMHQGDTPIAAPTLLLPLGQTGAASGDGDAGIPAGPWRVQITVQKGLPDTTATPNEAASNRRDLPSANAAPLWQDGMAWTRPQDPEC